MIGQSWRNRTRSGRRAAGILGGPAVALSLGALALAALGWGPEPAGAAIQPRALTYHVGFNGAPSWTPDGRLVFPSGRETSVQRVSLWITSADTDTAMQITWGTWDADCPAVSPDGRSVVFMSNRTGHYSLYLKQFDPDSTWAVADPQYVNLYPRWFKDGRRILYVSQRDTLQGLYVRDLATGRETCLFQSPQVIYFPTLSPDEKEVFFSWGKTHVYFDLYRVPVTGGEPQPWCQMPGFKMSPTFTPDGTHVLFARANEHAVYELWVAPLSAPLAGHKVETGLPSSYYPAFSPDGKRLAFCSRDETGVVDVWVAPWPPGEVEAH
ncbi:MAG TPA: hypothetical protein VMS93_05750 [Candidatus Saccharimonadales bacterium]|nr:hypothetical protein [Candidatus Saccharimonadales bacterium]